MTMTERHFPFLINRKTLITMYNSHIWTERTCTETAFVVSSLSYERSIWPSLSVEPRETNSGDKHCELSRPLVLSALFSPRRVTAIYGLYRYVAM